MIAFQLNTFAQNSNDQKSSNRPKLVVGFVVDQMRWDFLYRYYNHYSDSGFKRLIKNGFNCDNTLIPYTPTFTAPGHTCIYTGSVPAIHGIVGNNWYDNDLGREVYCTEDKNFKTVGSNSKAGEMSPNNLLTTTITDELRLFSNFKSKVIGIALKDRGAILPAGHLANAAYWYDGDNGNWISSTYYQSQLPPWVNQFNEKKLPESLMSNGWSLLDPINEYKKSTADEKSYEGKFPGEQTSSFPHNFNADGKRNYNNLIRSSPFGNTLTLEFAKAAIEGENLGSKTNTDFLTISCSSTDYIGHQFGPNSLENEDDYIRLDKDLAAFLSYLDQKYGSGEYLFFLTADHGVAHAPGFEKENRIPGGILNDGSFMQMLNEKCQGKFGIKNLIVAGDNYQLTFNNNLLDSANVNRSAVINYLLPIIKKTEGIANAFDINQLNTITLPDIQRKMLSNGYFPKRCGDIQLILLPGWLDGGKPTGTSHGLWNPYDAHIPLIWYGWRIKSGKTNRETYMTDIAATLAAMLRIQMPSGCIGQVVTEAFRTGNTIKKSK